jgi:hypothetical protein
VSDAVDTPSVRTRLEELGLTIATPERRNPDYVTKLVPSELAKWAPAIKASGAAPD